MKKRSLSILMIVCMLFSMMPSSAFASESNETQTEPHVHCVCGRTDCGTENGHNQNQVWTAWNGIDTIPNAEYIYLSDNVEATGVKSMTNKSLCLNGKVYKKSADNTEKHCAFSASSGNMTMITDCDNETPHKFTVTESGLWVLDEVNGDKVVTGGVITGFTESALCIYYRNLKLYGGNIVGNTKIADTSGGGAAVWITDGQFDMYGGTIQGNYIEDGSGSGVYISDGSFNMYGGTIQENNATYSGGGVYFDGQFNMYGGSIERNHAGSYGGGVSFSQDDIMHMYDGSISNNTSNSGGGVNAGISSKFFMSGGTIDNNVGDGVLIFGSCELEGNISISGNKSGGKNSNLKLTSSGVIIKIGAEGLSNTKPIGVTKNMNNSTSLNITKDYYPIDYSDKFTSDDKSYSIDSVKNASDDTYKVVLTNQPSDGIITYDEPTNGTFTVKVDDQTVNSNTEVSKDKTVTIEQVVPNQGYVIDTVKYNDTEIEKGEGDTYTFTMPADDVTISVTFKAIEYPVWVGGEQFTSEKLTISGNDGDAATDDGTATLTVGGTVDAPIYTLTLDNFKYSGDEIAIKSEDNLDIVLNGTNYIESSEEDICLRVSDGSLTITGNDRYNDKLTVKGLNYGIFGMVNGNPNGSGIPAIFIKDSTVTSTGATGAFNIAPTLDGEFKVFAGNDETAGEVDSITDNYDKKYVKIIPVPTVTVPNAIDNLVYNANDQALISAGSTTVGILQYALGTDSTTAPTTGWAETIPTAKYAGKYYVWYKVDGSENYAGIEPTFATEVTIGKATPEYTVPTGLTATYGDTLANVTLPTGWTWKDTTTSVGNAGTNTFIAIFTPADTDNYNTVEKSVSVYTKTNPGDYTNTTPSTNEGGAVLDNTIEELKESVPFTEDEIVKIEQGDDVKLWLEVTDISDTIPTEEKVLVEEKMNDRTLGMYLDVDMFKQIGTDNPVAITQFNSAIKVSFVLDDTLINIDNNVLRVYSVIRVHKGVADEIECEFDAETKILSFETDRLSTYAVVCKDTLINTEDVPETPSVGDVPTTGDTSNPILWLVLMLIGIATIVVGKRYKEMK